MKTREYYNLQRDMHCRISLIKEEEFSKQKVLDTIEEVFDEYKEWIVEGGQKKDMQREAILRSGFENKIYASDWEDVVLSYRLLSDYLNCDVSINREQMRESVGTPLTEYQQKVLNAVHHYIKKRQYVAAFKMTLYVLNDCDFKPSYNVVCEIRSIISGFAKSTNTNLDKIEPDYSFLEKMLEAKLGTKELENEGGER